MSDKNEKLIILKEIIELDIMFYNTKIESLKKEKDVDYSNSLINLCNIKISTLTDILTNLNDLL